MKTHSSRSLGLLLCALITAMSAGLATALLATGGANPTRPSAAEQVQLEDHTGRRNDVLVPSIVLADGVSRDEAHVIAEYVFHEHLGIMCGYVGDVVDAGHTWRVSTMLRGYVADDIEINKTDGSVFWADDVVLTNAVHVLSPNLGMGATRARDRALPFIAAPFPGFSPSLAAALEAHDDEINLEMELMILPSGRVESAQLLMVIYGAKDLGALLGAELSQLMLAWEYDPPTSDDPDTLTRATIHVQATGGQCPQEVGAQP